MEASSENLEYLFRSLIQSLSVSASGPPFVKAKCIQVLATFLVQALPALSQNSQMPLERITSTLHSFPIDIDSIEAIVLDLFGSLAEQMQRIEVPPKDKYPLCLLL